ncbi:8797_t:CDS:1, partial [Funneliformis caledonium]
YEEKAVVITYTESIYHKSEFIGFSIAKIVRLKNLNEIDRTFHQASDLCNNVDIECFIYLAKSSTK